MNIQFLVPVYNERDNINPLLSFLGQIASSVDITTGTSHNWSVIFADNCSVDGTVDCIKSVFTPAMKTEIIAFRRNFGFHFSSSYLLVHSDADMSVLIPADMQIPVESVSESIAKSLTEETTVLLCRRRDLHNNQNLPVQLLKRIFYSILKSFQSDVIPGFFGMGIYCSEEIRFLRVLKEPNFQPFQIRLVIPRALISPKVTYFKEQSRQAGRSGFGLTGYVREAISIIVRSHSIQKSGIKIVLLLSILATGSMALLMLVTKVVAPSLILPGFTTISLIVLICTDLNLLGLYLLALRLDGNMNKLQSSFGYAKRTEL